MKYVLYYVKKLHSYSGKIVYINLLGMTFISFLDGMGVLLLISLISISGMVGGSTSEANPILKILGDMKDLPITLGLPAILCLYTLIVLGHYIIERKLGKRNAIIIQGFLHRTRVEIYRDILHSNWHFFIKRRKSDLINLLTTEIGRMTGGITNFIQLVSSLIFTAVQVGIALWLSPKLTILVLLFGGVLGLFSKKFVKKSNQLGNRTSELSQEYLAGITDQLQGIKDIKTNMLEESRLSWLHALTKRMLKEHIDYFDLKTASQLFYKIASTILMAVFIYISIALLHAQMEQFLIIIVIFSRLWPRITGIQSSLEQIASTIPAFKAIRDLQKECVVAKEFNHLNSRNDKPVELKFGMECKDVHFRYSQQASIYALQNINLDIPSNQMTAIVGRSGAGKSTLIDLLMGLIQPERGQVLIDGIPLSSDNLLSLRQSISYVPQDPFLFNGSIRENLLMIEPNASEDEMWDALKFASAEFVGMLPQGLDTLIGDRGVRLSGGERQRLVLARAILRKPSILILDEATSSLDSENEEKIQEAISNLKGKMTIIVIAHRLSTIRNADKVVVLDQGRLVQMGSFNKLAKEPKGIFRNLLKSQMEMNVI